jgi:hypothetical protein
MTTTNAAHSFFDSLASFQQKMSTKPQQPSGPWQPKPPSEKMRQGLNLLSSDLSVPQYELERNIKLNTPNHLRSQLFLRSPHTHNPPSRVGKIGNLKQGFRNVGATLANTWKKFTNVFRRSGRGVRSRRQGGKQKTKRAGRRRRFYK